MNWTKLANGLKGIDRIECDMVPYNDEYALRLVTPALAITVAGLQHSEIPEQLASMVRSFNVGATEKVFSMHEPDYRPYILSRAHLNYEPGDRSKTLYIFEGIHQKNYEEKKLFFIRKRYFDLIPGEVVTLAAPAELGSILFISTESFGYIMPYVPKSEEWEDMKSVAKMLLWRV